MLDGQGSVPAATVVPPSALSSSTPPSRSGGGDGDEPASGPAGPRHPLPSYDDDHDDVDALLGPPKRIKAGAFPIGYVDVTSPRRNRRGVHVGGPPGGYHDLRGWPDEDGLEYAPSRDAPPGGVARALLGLRRRRRPFLPLRILLLSLHLASALAAFWILDSVKEPTLALLVDGELGRHQPRAKMLSFAVVVASALCVEWTGRRGRRGWSDGGGGDDGEAEDANARLERDWEERDLPSFQRPGASAWHRMRVGTGRLWRRHLGRFPESDPDGVGGGSGVTPLMFYAVGSVYIHFLAAAAFDLRRLASQPDGGGGDWHRTLLGYSLFALIESYGSVSITLFWSFANSHLTLDAAERHYGSVVAVAQAGAILGSSLPALTAGRTGGRGGGEGADVTPALILAACGAIGLGMAAVAAYASLFPRPMGRTEGAGVGAGPAPVDGDDGEPVTISTAKLRSPSDDAGLDEKDGGGNETSGSLLGGASLIFRHEYLRLVLAASVLYEVALTCMHYEMNLIGLDRFGVGISVVGDEHGSGGGDNGGGMTYIQFMGWYGQTVNVLSLLLSYYAFPHLVRSRGLRYTIRIFPTVLLGVTVTAFVVLPGNLPFLFVSLSVCKALTYSVHDPSEEVLYMPTSDAVKFRSKFWIDAVGTRVAKAAGAAVNEIAGSAGGVVKYGSVPSVVASLALWCACARVGVLFDELVERGEVVGEEEEDADGERVELAPMRDEDEDAASLGFDDEDGG